MHGQNGNMRLSFVSHISSCVRTTAANHRYTSQGINYPSALAVGCLIQLERSVHPCSFQCTVRMETYWRVSSYSKSTPCDSGRKSVASTAFNSQPGPRNSRSEILHTLRKERVRKINGANVISLALARIRRGRRPTESQDIYYPTNQI